MSFSFAHVEGDTSNTFAELVSRFNRTGKPLQVDFRKLVSWVPLGDQLTHHLHSYPAKLLPHIGHFFVRAQCLRGTRPIILDPFCGSGTVALEASIANVQPYIADSNPLALLISRVKTTGYDLADLSAAIERALSRSRRYKTGPVVQLVNSQLWYLPEIKRSLERILRSVNEEPNDRTRDFLRVCFSATARRLSNADPAISVPVRSRTKETFSDARNGTCQ